MTRFKGLNNVVLAMSLLAAVSGAQAGVINAAGQDGAVAAPAMLPAAFAPEAEGGIIHLPQPEMLPAIEEEPAPVPEPASVALLGLGLAGLLIARRRK